MSCGRINGVDMSNKGSCGMSGWYYFVQVSSEILMG